MLRPPRAARCRPPGYACVFCPGGVSCPGMRARLGTTAAATRGPLPPPRLCVCFLARRSLLPGNACTVRHDGGRHLQPAAAPPGGYLCNWPRRRLSPRPLYLSLVVPLYTWLVAYPRPRSYPPKGASTTPLGPHTRPTHTPQPPPPHLHPPPPFLLLSCFLWPLVAARG